MVNYNKMCHQHHLDRFNPDLVRIVIRQLFGIPYKVITEISNQTAGKIQLIVVLSDLKFTVILL